MTHAELVKLLDIMDRIDTERESIEDMRGGVVADPYPTAYDNNIISNHHFTRGKENWNNDTRAQQILKVSKTNRIEYWE